MILSSLLLLLLAVLGAPLFAIIGAGALLGYLRADVDLTAVPIEIYGIAETPILLAIPLFTFAGYILSESRAAARLVRLSSALLGWLPGGLAMVAVATCSLFTAFTGGSGVTIIAIGALLFPALIQAGYSERFTLGLVTSSGSLGLLFAPSLPLIIYGIIAEVSIDDLFIAGILPGTLMMVALAGFCIWRNRANRRPLSEFSWGEVGAALRESVWELPLPVVVLGGIYSGVFAVSEAAAVTVVYVLVVELLIYREVPFRRLAAIVRDSMVLVGGILLILGISLASTNYMIDAQVPQQLIELVTRYVSSPTSFLLLLIAFLMLIGCILHIFSALVLVVPLMLPVAAQYGIDPVHLGIIFVATMELGYLLPPIGLNLYIASYRFGRPVLDVCLATVPFILILLGAVLLITFVPSLSLAFLKP
ncbi:MAG: TRAP transporter large permease subunit [Gammaproteobacteria bacterium]|nr:TRAP transporter large permease subunit [Gammaproteobacteria bacterium]